MQVIGEGEEEMADILSKAEGGESYYHVVVVIVIIIITFSYIISFYPYYNFIKWVLLFSHPEKTKSQRIKISKVT